MEWVNYHHLLYFWLVAREGSLARASAELRLAQSTVSKQIHLLEQQLGQQLFAKSGRRLALTESGKIAFGYADEIFGLGREMMDTLRDQKPGAAQRLTVGIADVVPKMVAERVLEPAYAQGEPIRLVCREDEPARLLSDLALHELDLVLTDTPASPSARPQVFNHFLGESRVGFFGRAELVARHRGHFPESLHGAPVLLPLENTALRRSLERWFLSKGIRPKVVGEFEDSALLKVFGLRGAGLFPASLVISKEVQEQYKVKLAGVADGVHERLYAVTVQRRITHPVVVAICETAKTRIYSGQ